MLGLLQRLKERKSFIEATAKAREEEKQRSGASNSQGPPIFNKRVFGVGSIAITATAARVMKRNERLEREHEFHLNESERLVLKNIVDSLRLIHRGRNHVKLAIANCLTHETYKAFEYVEKRPHEKQFSCYYILHGSLEATYEPAAPADGEEEAVVSHQMFQPNIVYTHSMGEYLGLLSHGDEDQSDLAPPATLYCKTDCELLRVDRAKFHSLMRSIEAQLRNETVAFLNADWNFLCQLPDSEKDALVPHLVKENIRPDSLVLKQGERNDWLYFVTAGRCQAYRILSFQRDGRQISEAFALGTFDKGVMFGEESPLHGCESSLSVCAKSHVTVYKLHRNQLNVLGRQNLSRLVRERSGTVPTDAQLRQRRSTVRTWQAYRCETAASLAEGRRLDLSRVKRIQSAPSSLSSASKKRHLEFIEGETLAKVDSGIEKKEPAKPTAPPAGSLIRRAASKNGRDSLIQNETESLLTFEVQEGKKGEEGKKKLLTGTVTQFLLTAKQRGSSSSIDSREIHRRFANKDYENRLKQGWIFAAETHNEDLANNHYSPIDTGEFVARAKNAVRLQAERVRSLRSRDSSTSAGVPPADCSQEGGLEQDRRLAATGLAFHRLRLHLLRHRLNRLDRGRADAAADEAAAAAAASASAEAAAASSLGLNGGVTLSERERQEIGQKSQRRRNAAKFVDKTPPHQEEHQEQPVRHQQPVAQSASERRNALMAGRLWLSARPSGERFISMYNSRRKGSSGGSAAADPGDEADSLAELEIASDND